MPIRGIIFDFDGTLLDSMGYWANASYQIMTENGVADPEAAFAVSEKHPLFDACQIWHDRFGARQQGPQMFERISAVMKDNYAHRIKPYPGERDFLDSLRAAGVRLCVATSSVPAAVREALAANDLDGYFDFVLGTDEVGRGKEFLITGSRLTVHTGLEGAGLDLDDGDVEERKFTAKADRISFDRPLRDGIGAVEGLRLHPSALGGAIEDAASLPLQESCLEEGLGHTDHTHDVGVDHAFHDPDGVAFDEGRHRMDAGKVEDA